MSSLKRNSLRAIITVVISLGMICSPMLSLRLGYADSKPMLPPAASYNASGNNLVAVSMFFRRLAACGSRAAPTSTPCASTAPQAPNAYQQTGSLPPAGYDDPKPTIAANYNNYLTQLTQVVTNPSGPIGSFPMQAPDPTAAAASVGGLTADLYFRQFNFTAPALGLSGRAGMGVAAAFSYSSKTWIKDSATNTMVFNADRGFPAPGWRLGFGAIQTANQNGNPYFNGLTGKSSFIYLAPDGTRHDLALTTAGIYKSYDSTYLKFDSGQQILFFPNGTRMKFGAYSYSPVARDYQALPIEIKDRNGNFGAINYKTLDNQKVVLDYVTDTAGRRVDFNYQNNRLVSISQNRNGVVFYFVRIDYQAVTIQTDFYQMTTDPPTINGAQVYLPARITYPAGVNLRFGYTSYGQLFSIQKWVPTITSQGVERMIASTTFSLPSGVGNPQSDCPGFSSRQEWAENWQGGSPQNYQYNVEVNGFGVSDPTGRRFVANLGGLTHTMWIYAPGADNWTKKDEATYVTDSGVPYNSNLRVAETKSTALTGSIPQIKRATFSYTQLDGMWLIEHNDEYGAFGYNLFRRTFTSYTSYPSQYILGLPRRVSVHNESFTAISQVWNNYDQTGTFVDSNNQTASYFIDAAADGVIQHDNTNYGAGFTARGNITSVTQDKVEGGAVTGSRIIKRVSFDTNGNVRAVTDGAGNRQQFQFGDYCVNKPGGSRADSRRPLYLRGPGRVPLRLAVGLLHRVDRQDVQPHARIVNRDSDSYHELRFRRPTAANHAARWRLGEDRLLGQLAGDSHIAVGRDQQDALQI